MPTTTFNNAASDGDYSNAANYDNGLPDSSTDLVLAAIGTTGSAACLNLTDSSGTGANYIGGFGAIICHGTATVIQTNGGFLNNAVSLTAIGCIFTTDPGAANYTTSASTQFNASMAISGTISDDGSAIWGAVTITASGISAPAMTGSAATTFAAGATASPSINMPNATFGAISQGGPGVNLIAGTLGATVTWSSVTSLGTTGVAATLTSQSGGTVTLVLPGSGGTVSYTAFTPPSASQIVFGNTILGVDGNQHVAGKDDVLFGVATGTDTGTVTLPANGDDYLHGATPFGRVGSLIDGNWYRANGAASDALMAPLVDSTASFGVGGLVDGTDIADALLDDQVKNDIDFGPGGDRTGSYTGGGGGGTGLIVPVPLFRRR